jgi:hypothetical protein
MKIVELKNKHIAAWQRELRKAKPEDIAHVGELPDAMFSEIAVQCAFNAGWLEDVTQEQIDGLTFKQAQAWALDIWKAYNAAREVDPN